MPEDQDQEVDDQDDEQEQEVRLSPKDLKALRKAAKERDDLAAKLRNQERDMAFMKANLDLDDPKVKYFVKGYEGELTPDAIRAQAEADGFLSKFRQPTADLDAQQRIARASAGAGESGEVDLGELISQAKSPDEVMKIMIAAGRPTSWNRPGDR